MGKNEHSGGFEHRTISQEWRCDFAQFLDKEIANFLKFSLVQLGLSCVHVVNCKKSKNGILGSKWAHVSKFDRPNSQTWPRNAQEWPPDGACGPTFGAHTLLARRHFFTAF